MPQKHTKNDIKSPILNHKIRLLHILQSHKLT